jgi:hypothetical protein
VMTLLSQLVRSCTKARNCGEHNIVCSGKPQNAYRPGTPAKERTIPHSPFRPSYLGDSPKLRTWGAISTFARTESYLSKNCGLYRAHSSIPIFMFPTFLLTNIFTGGGALLVASALEGVLMALLEDILHVVVFF